MVGGLEKESLPVISALVLLAAVGFTLVAARLAQPRRVHSRPRGDCGVSHAQMESRARLSADIKAVWTCRPRNWRSGQQDGASEKYLVLEAALHRDLSLRTTLHRAPTKHERAVAEPDR